MDSLDRLIWALRTGHFKSSGAKEYIAKYTPKNFLIVNVVTSFNFKFNRHVYCVNLSVADDQLNADVVTDNGKSGRIRMSSLVILEYTRQNIFLFKYIKTWTIAP